MIRVGSRTGGETTVHENLFLGEHRHKAFIFKAHTNMPKLYRLLNVLGFFLTNSFSFTRNVISRILLLVAWRAMQRCHQPAVLVCSLICATTPYCQLFLYITHSCIYLLVPERLLLTSQFQWNTKYFGHWNSVQIVHYENPDLLLQKLLFKYFFLFCKR